MTSQKLNEEHEILRRFMAVVVSSAFKNSLMYLLKFQRWGVAKGSSISGVAKFKGDKTSECKLSNGWSRSYKEVKLLISAGNMSAREVTGLVAHDCGYPLSRYTCRATRVAADFLDFIAFCRCNTGVALHPLEILVSHLPPPRVPGGVAPKFGCLKRCRATRGRRSYSCGCRATLCN